MKRKIRVPNPVGGFTTTTILATFTATICGKRLTFYALRLPQTPHWRPSTTLTERGSLARFANPIAVGDVRLSSAKLIARGRQILADAIQEHGARKVARVIARTTKATKALKVPR